MPDDDYAVVSDIDEGGTRHVTVEMLLGWADVAGLWPEERWREFADRDPMRPFEMSPAQPTLSLLAYMDEGSLQLDAASLISECASALPVTRDPRACGFLERLLSVAKTAVEERAVL